MDDASVRVALSVARAAEQCGCFEPGDWPDVAVGMLLEGNEDPEIAELAGLSRQASGWDTDPLVAAACERHGVTTVDAGESTNVVARLMADDLRARRASVTEPMIRLLARLAPPDFESDLANQCFSLEDYLDCDCTRVDPDSRRNCDCCRRCSYPHLSSRHSRDHCARHSKRPNPSRALTNAFITAGHGPPCPSDDTQLRENQPDNGMDTTAVKALSARPRLRPSPEGQPSAASWPQAAAISWPRVSRTVHATPPAFTSRTNSRSTGFGDASHFEPGVGFNGITFTCTN